MSIQVTLHRRQVGGSWTTVDGFQRNTQAFTWHPTKTTSYDCRKQYYTTMGWLATPGDHQGGASSTVLGATC